jgi:hypothetical protein
MRTSSLYFLTLLSVLSYSCKEKKDATADTVQFTVERADDWTALFKRTSGWFGGDGIFAIPFSGQDAGSAEDSIMFLFSDTMIGQIDSGALKPGYQMINNSCMILQGKEPDKENAKFLVNPGKGGNPSSLFVPATSGIQQGDYYWLGDGFVNTDNDNSLNIFAYRIRNTHDSSAFPFREVGNALIVIPKGSKYPFSDHRQVELPFGESPDSIRVSFGVGVLANTTSQIPDGDGFVYIYGIRGKNKALLAARVKPSALENFTAWEFYNNNGWTNTLSEATPIADSVSNELSVSPIGDGKYALIYQYAGIMPTIYMQVGPTPVGPFGPRQKVWSTADDIKEKDLFTYNAKAHPAISKPSELIVSYNVNSFNFFKQIEQIPDLYRPRFIRITFTKP